MNVIDSECLERDRHEKPAPAFSHPALAAAFVAAALAAGSARAASGAYSLAAEGSHRQCRVVLSADETGEGRAVRFPAGCRRAIPILKDAATWVAEGEAIRLVGKEARTLLTFTRAGDGFAATGESGERYRLTREGDAPAARPRYLPPAPFVTGVPQTTSIDPATAPKPETLPGLYSLDRMAERDTCRLVLGTALVDAEERREAHIAEGCRDAGLRVFDPASWRYVAGRLTLRSRRGHEVSLVSERKDQWRRDPEVGAMLELRKIEAR